MAGVRTEADKSILLFCCIHLVPEHGSKVVANILQICPRYFPTVCLVRNHKVNDVVCHEITVNEVSLSERPVTAYLDTD